LTERGNNSTHARRDSKVMQKKGKNHGFGGKGEEQMKVRDAKKNVKKPAEMRQLAGTGTYGKT